MLKEMQKTNEKDTVVGENVMVTGKLHTSSNIQVNGMVKGEIESEGGIIVGKTATIEGPIAAAEIKIEGTVRGSIIASHSVEITSEAKVIGDIQTDKLSIQFGALFVGKSLMQDKKSTEKVKNETDKSDQKETASEKSTQSTTEPELEVE